jgi:hypothetical protein
VSVQNYFFLTISVLVNCTCKDVSSLCEDCYFWGLDVSCSIQGLKKNFSPFFQPEPSEEEG